MNPVIDILLKGAVVLLIACVLSGLLRNASAAVRHRVWSVGFAILLLLPLAGLALPAWEVGLPGPIAERISATPAATQAATPDATGAASPTDAARHADPGLVDPRTAAADARLAGDEAAGPLPGSTSPAAGGLPAWPTLLLGLWGLGVAVLLGRLATGLVSAAWITRRARPLRDLHWELSATRFGRELGLRRPVRLRVSPHVEVPVTCGLLRPAILVPEAARDWSAARRDVVLAHELAHVARRDCLTQVLADAVRALHWVNPLAWLGGRTLRAEQERACDDLVLRAAVAESSEYAHHLIEIARGMTRRRPLASAALAMARPSQLEGRVLAVLDPTRDRRAPNRPGSLAAGVAALVLLLPLAAFRPVPPQTSTGEEGARAGSLEAERPQEGEEQERAEREGGFLPRVLAPAADEPAGEDLDGQDPASEPREDASLADRLDADIPIAARDTLEERIVEVFVRALQNGDASMRSQAAHALGSAELPQAVEPLARVVTSDESANVRSQAAWALGMIEDEGGVTALTEALRDESAHVRSQAAWALGMIESDRAVDGLTGALDDEDPRVRSQAAWALGMIESDEAVGGLIRALRSDESVGVRRQAAWALGMIESDAAVEALIDAIEDPDAEVSRKAMWALSQVIG